MPHDVNLDTTIASDDLETAIARAEQALLVAKADGGNCSRVVLTERTDAGADSRVSAVA